MNPIDPEGIQRAIDMAHNSPCVLCGKLSEQGTLVSFIPDNPQEYGAAQGQKRMIFYSLCPECSRAPRAFKRAEKIIKLEVHKGRTS
jgi:hypothetical protein